MDLTAIVGAARRLPAVELRAAGERMAVSLRVLATVVESVGAVPQLAQELHARAPADTVALIVPAGSGQARIDFGQRQIAIPAALRDAILSALERTAEPAPRQPPAAGAALATLPIDAALTTRPIDASAFTAARAIVPPAQSDPPPARTRPPAHASFGTPLLDAPAGEGEAAQRLRRTVERSGLFLESHLAASVRDGRSAAAQWLHEELRTAPSGATRTAAQLEVLTRDAIVLQGPAWPGRPATIELARERCADPDAQRGAEGDAVAFSAQLALDLPHLGPLQVRLRLVGATVAVTVECAQAAAIARELPRLAEQFELRGLKPAALQAAEFD
jgi:hypothetical protein